MISQVYTLWALGKQKGPEIVLSKKERLGVGQIAHKKLFLKYYLGVCFLNFVYKK